MQWPDDDGPDALARAAGAESATESARPRDAVQDDGSRDSASAAPLSHELALRIYRHMALARAVAERFVALQRDGVVTSHASGIGEEATVLGAAAAMNDADWIFPGPRDLAAALWRGVSVAAYAHHALGTARDIAHGRAAPDPPFSRAGRVASASAVVGAHIPHAVGVAWAARLRKADVASLVFFGEGATSTGDFHTALNFAGVTRAPVVAVCKNNGWSTSTPASKQTASAGFAVKAVAYGLRGVRVDGADVAAMHGVVRDARARAAAGLGATLVEAVIPGVDRADPLACMRRDLEARGLWDGERERHLVEALQEEVADAVADAARAPKPGRDTLFRDVYAEPPWPLAGESIE
jgi:TPP-dependent pyruvate/acetoin dehydrogenase alpha subunit